MPGPSTRGRSWCARVDQSQRTVAVRDYRPSSRTADDVCGRDPGPVCRGVGVERRDEAGQPAAATVVSAPVRSTAAGGRPAAAALRCGGLAEHRVGQRPASWTNTRVATIRSRSTSRSAVKTGANELVVAVWDPTDTGYQPKGKQVLKPEASCTRRSRASGRPCGWKWFRATTSSR